MANDTDIFGDAPSKTRGDADIFKDISAPKAEAVAMTPQTVEQPPKGMFGYQMSPAQWETEKKFRAQQDWGKGAAKLAYDAGGRVTDLTGSPLLGAIISSLPEAAQMAIGGQLGKSAAPIMEGAGRILMESALKPSIQEVKKGKAAPAVETMLREGFNPTTSGVEKMKSTLDDLGGQVDNSIANSGAQIDVHAVADYVPEAYKRFAAGPQAVSAIEDLGKVQTGLLDHPMVMGARTIPVQTAQEMKTGYQRAVGDKGYGELKTAMTEGEKQIARGFREKIGEAVPAVLDPLKRESEIISALKMAERQAAVDARKNPLGLGWLAQPWMIPFWMWDRSAGAKALTARALYSGSEMIPGSAGAGAGALYGAMQQPGGALYQP